MGWMCEKREACCCAPLGNAVVVFLSHMVIHGVVVAIFVFTNYIAPPLNHIDYFFAGNGLCLSLVCFVSLFLIRAKGIQFLRSVSGLLIAIGLIGNITGTVWYSIEKWEQEKKTLVWQGLRPRHMGSDPFWTFILIIFWIVAFLNIYYIYCVLACFCNPYKTYLFVDDYQSPYDESEPDTTIPVMRYQDRYQGYKPYPVQRN